MLCQLKYIGAEYPGGWYTALNKGEKAWDSSFVVSAQGSSWYPVFGELALVERGHTEEG